ncbi:MAG: alpha/beta fold hydrolase [Pseudomonadota bacterium]
MARAASAKPPSLFHRLAEGRALVEHGAFRLLRGRLRQLPKGDGHAVLVLPGFMAGDESTRPMRSVLRDLGYEALGWRLGRNVRASVRREAEVLDLVERAYEISGRKVSLIGCSLGGLFAREAAKRRPDHVRCVITLGAPLSGDPREAAIGAWFERENAGMGLALHDPEVRAALREAPPVPTTAIFSKTDGVVAWRSAYQKPGPEAESVEVEATHLGLPVNPLALVAVADRLAQPEGAWTPFRRTGWRARAFGDGV